MFGFRQKQVDDGKSLAQPLPEELQVVDLGLLGAGGVARVYRVRDEVLGREVALKVLRPELTTEKIAIDNFVNEARLTAQLDHPNIPTVYAMASDKKRSSVFTMKVLEGQTLQHVLEENARQKINGQSAAIDVLLRICDAVAFAHAKGVLHLDIKPANIIVADYGQIYLMDWGFARRKAELPKEPGEKSEEEGTPAYMAPEQATCELWKLDERTDIFALGGVLYRILCGRSPYGGMSFEEAIAKAVKGEVTPLDAVAARNGETLPGRLVSICMKALAADPMDRYQSVQAFQQELERYARGLAQLPQRTFKAGETIITEGEPGDAAYVIIDGECIVTKLVGGQLQELRRLNAGELFGEVAIFSGKPRLATVRAVIDTVVGFIDQAALREEMERTSFMSLAIRTIGSTFHELDRKFERQRQRARVVEVALRHMALYGECGRTPWKPLLATLTSNTGASEEDVSSWVLGSAGVSIEGESLVLRG